MAAANLLKARALQWLAQRDHSRQELGERLRHWVRAQRQVRASMRTASSLVGPQGASEGAAAAADPALPGPEDIEPLLDALQAQGLLLDARFAESRIHARAARFGQRRIHQELRQHGVQMPEAWAETLRATELQRACELWSRRFGAPAPARSADEARQARFLAGRGFSTDTIRAVLSWAASGCPEPETDASAE